ncbi:MAG: ABC transporter permease [Gemmatimonadetes bacterium]|nr:ABC transporter permease [Gemmatimonadota bacterium]
MSLSETASTPLRYLNDTLKGWAFHTQEYFRLLGRSLHGSLSRPFYGRDLVIQMDAIGVGSIGIVLLTGLFTGMVLALQSAVEMKQFGATIYIGRLVGASTIRELGPVLTALMVTGRAGSGMAAEIGAMKVTEQVDAHEAMDVNLVRYPIAPRFMACLLMIPFLTIIADLAGVLGGFMVACHTFGVSEHEYWQYSAQYIQTWDHMTGLGKSVFFGGAIGLISCYKGFTTKGGAQGVGRSCTEAFVASFIAIMVLDFFLALVANTLHEMFGMARRLV